MRIHIIVDDLSLWERVLDLLGRNMIVAIQSQRKITADASPVIIKSLLEMGIGVQIV